MGGNEQNFERESENINPAYHKERQANIKQQEIFP